MEDLNYLLTALPAAFSARGAKEMSLGRTAVLFCGVPVAGPCVLQAAGFPLQPFEGHAALRLHLQ